ncbi:MAG: AmpG family muropeptide MFS transporter [Bacteroides sp.]|nr:AmpG family muropeptide MFS transporter [Bacteroides sp.]
MTRRAASPWAWIPTLYFAQGLPYVAVMTVSVIMYKRLGVSNTDIALYTGWLYLPWVIKPFWSPFIDIFGQKRRWTVIMQWVLAASLAAVALALPGPGFFRLSLAAFWITAFASATHDIAADGFYMLGLSEHQQSLFVGIRTTFYRLAILAGQGGIVVMAGRLEEATGNIPLAWSRAMMAAAALLALLAVWHSFILPHPPLDTPRGRGITPRKVLSEFAETFRSFFAKQQTVAAVAFMLLYRLPEAQLVKLINPFLLDPPEVGGLGLSTAQVGVVYGTVGVIALMAGGVTGGIVAARGGLRKWLMPMAWAMSLTCATFLYLSLVPEPGLLTVNLCVAIEQFGYGFGGTAYTLYLIYYALGPNRTSHYAIATGFMALGMMLPGMAAGWIQEMLGSYTAFFIWTMACCAITIAAAARLKVPAEFGRK